MGGNEGSIWIATLYVSQRTRQKLIERHRLTVEEIEDAIVCVARLRFKWDNDPERGRRAMVEVEIRSRRVLVVLYPVNDPFGGSWNLGSAYPA